jgi:lipopolysaccharide/colanic/teichoic acid biosynthesis glycosyltransferase
MVVLSAILVGALIASGWLDTTWREALRILIGYAVLDFGVTTLWFVVTRGERRRHPGEWRLSQPAEQRALATADFAPSLERLREIGASDEAMQLSARHCGREGAVCATVGVIEDQSDDIVGLAIARTRLNDCRHLIAYLLRCHTRVENGGWLVGHYTPHDFAAQPAGLAGWWPLLVHRVWPKIPWFNRSYFAVTGGKNRHIARTEMWGRLQYAGFSLIEEMRTATGYAFIARKLFEPAVPIKPSYYPVIALDRVGYHGRIIKLHKLRSMYPFSEFIQKRVFDQQRLGNTGKFASDPRISRWGQFCRRYWIDELPQVFDWLRGELKLVGIRPLSRHYFTLYPRQYQEDFVRAKPGLIPPLFDESTSSFDDVVRIEGTYLRDYAANPLKADCLQLWKTISSILSGVRSR